jgi:hypothetical protein
MIYAAALIAIALHGCVSFGYVTHIKTKCEEIIEAGGHGEKCSISVETTWVTIGEKKGN